VWLFSAHPTTWPALLAPWQRSSCFLHPRTTHRSPPSICAPSSSVSDSTTVAQSSSCRCCHRWRHCLPLRPGTCVDRMAHGVLADRSEPLWSYNFCVSIGTSTLSRASPTSGPSQARGSSGGRRDCPVPPAATKACGSVHGAGGMPDAAARCSSVRRPRTGSSGVGGGSGTRVWRQ